MNFIDFYAGNDDNDRRLDKIIRVLLPQITMSEVYKGIRKNLIRVNDKKTSQEKHVFTGDKISIAEFLVNPGSAKNEVHHENSSIELPPVVFKNDHLIFFNKPVNLSVQSSAKNQNSLEKNVKQYFIQNKKNQESLSFMTGPLHRIDRNTSGLITFSWSLEGARWFSENIKTHAIKKTYLALIQGKLSGSENWQDSILKAEASDEKAFHTVKISNEEKEGKTALTTVIPLAYGEYKNTKITLAQFKIETGRQHQIRVQSSSHGYPLLGDTAYGGKNFNGDLKTYFLHAYKLHFPYENPLNLPEEITAEIPQNFKTMINKTCDMGKVVL